MNVLLRTGVLLLLMFAGVCRAQTDVLSLGEGNQVVLANAEQLNRTLNQSFTIETWVYPQTESQAQHFVSTLAANSDGWALGTTEDNAFEVTFSSQNSNGLIKLDSLSAPDKRRCAPLTSGRWYHLAVGYNADSGELVLYVDGFDCNRVKITPGFLRYTQQARFVLGTDGSEVQAFSGFLSELRLWSVVRSKTQLRHVMSERIDQADGLLAHWPLNEGAGAIISEQTGRFNEAKLNWQAPWAQSHLPFGRYQPPEPACQTNRCGWYTQGSQIMSPNGERFKIKAVNWFGFQSQTNLVHGLWTVDFLQQLNKIKALGFNTIRLPFSNSILRPDAKVDTYIEALPGNGLFYRGMPALDALDTFINAARLSGLYVILDRHNLIASVDNPDLWYNEQVTEAQWIADWQMLAQRYRDNPTIIGADIHNEPHGIATWGNGQVLTDWAMAAQKAGNAILSSNPDWLIFVEGIDWSDDFFESEILPEGGVLIHPIELHTQNKVVYSPHEYGPNNSGYRHRWFEKGFSFAQAKQVWDNTWGYILEQQIAPVFVGEFGGRFVDKASTVALDYPNRPGEAAMTQGDAAIWFEYIVRYLQQRDVDFGYWGWTPNSINTGGLLDDNWQVIREKVVALNPLLQQPLSLQVQPDSFLVPEGQSAILNVLANDYSSFDSLFITQVSDPQKGVLAVDGELLRFTPFVDACGEDGFEYQANDGLLTESVQVKLTIVLHDDMDGDCVRDEDDRWPLDPRYAFDNDVDNLPDNWELAFFGTLDAASALGDSDGDGLSNIQEWADGTNPNDNRSGGTDADLDGDSMVDRWEVATFGTIERDGSGDYDNDGLSDAREFALGLDPKFNPSVLLPTFLFLLEQGDK